MKKSKTVFYNFVIDDIIYSERSFMQISDLLNKLNIKYNDIALYKEALTHTSYANEHNIESYERLEFLGDAILELIISEYLYKKTDSSEGVMTRLRSHYVCENALYEYSVKLGLNEYIYLGHGQKEQDGIHSKAIVADIFESFLAAVYLDNDIDEVKKFINKYIIPIIESDTLDFFQDYKSKLQEYVQTDKKSLEYKIIKEVGPAHDKTFEVEVMIDDIVYGKGIAKSKKEAEQKAAKDALSKTNIIK